MKLSVRKEDAGMRDAVAAIGAAVMVVAALLVAGTCRAQDPAPDKALSVERCAVCLQPGGEGVDAPAGNDGRADLNDIVGSIRDNMPPVPRLSPGEVAAIVNYIRTAWDNDFDVTTAEEVAAIIDALGGEDAEQVTIWDGVYTSDQVARGEAATITCSRCDGSGLNGAADDPDMKSNPPPTRVGLRRGWTGRTLACSVAGYDVMIFNRGAEAAPPGPRSTGQCPSLPSAAPVPSGMA